MIDVIYVDVLLLENFLMNFLLLYIVGRYSKIKIKTLRITAAALFGGMYVIVLFLPEFTAMYSVPMRIAISIIMVTIAFMPYKIKEFIKLWILFFLTSFIVGGCIFAVLFLTQKDVVLISGAIVVPSKFIIIGIIIAIFFVKIGFDYFETYYLTEKNKIEMEIHLSNKSCKITALIDTGNSLRDPITNEPVIVVYMKPIFQILPDELLAEIINEQNNDVIMKKIMDSSLKTRIRLIPYKALGVENGLLTGIRVDKVAIRYKSHYAVLKGTLIALYTQPISREGSYQALAYPELLKGGV
ncbi:hypothetical protein Q428_07980 [Fervidicella metallireducens AeB]|uniref:Sporulation sigma-E factor-processing peptidase n=1 Tax=Fervidicella metallireducens AeB TaxID=1403537 RepID=A0A017RVL0_9CLOT|nr:sigma-E processing peptidase SpoIIGA [Fervidicella metallireducens]EYE88439.1 hypothetical protein Q428_07980 [Fervidicella metallireducens AeB]